MYAWAIAHSNGFEPRGTIRSFDNKYYSKSAAVGPVSMREPYHNDEFSFLQSAAKHELKIPITGAYTLAVWSYDEHHLPKTGRLGGGLSRQDEVDARRELTLDIARNIIRPNLEALIDLGATWIQIDEPGASTEEDELDIFVESFNVSVEGLDCTFSTHLCFSDYDLFFPAIEGMGGCRQYCVGFANYDTTELGTSGADRPGLRGDLQVARPAVRADPRPRRHSTSTRTSSSRPSSCATGSCTRSRSSAIRRGSTSARTAACGRAAGTSRTRSSATWSRARASRRSP